MTKQKNAYDRYMEFADRAGGRPELLDELRTIFAADASIHIRDRTITGIDAILEFYRGFFAEIVECSHYWITSEVSENIIEAPWVAALRLTGGRLLSISGFERTYLNADGLIKDLRNYPNGS